jgi:hypothetical protein
MHARPQVDRMIDNGILNSWDDADLVVRGVMRVCVWFFQWVPYVRMYVRRYVRTVRRCEYMCGHLHVCMTLEP